MCFTLGTYARLLAHHEGASLFCTGSSPGSFCKLQCANLFRPLIKARKCKPCQCRVLVRITRYTFPRAYVYERSSNHSSTSSNPLVSCKHLSPEHVAHCCKITLELWKVYQCMVNWSQLPSMKWLCKAANNTECLKLPLSMFTYSCVHKIAGIFQNLHNHSARNGSSHALQTWKRASADTSVLPTNVSATEMYYRKVAKLIVNQARHSRNRGPASVTHLLNSSPAIVCSHAVGMGSACQKRRSFITPAAGTQSQTS